MVSVYDFKPDLLQRHKQTVQTTTKPFIAKREAKL